MRQDEIARIMKSLRQEGKWDSEPPEDGTYTTDTLGDLMLWMKEHMAGVLKCAGIQKYIKPYNARVSERHEEYLHTWKGGQQAMVTRRFMEVYETQSGNVLGEVEIDTWKSLRPICEPFKRGDQWYILASNGGVQLYSLPDLALVAETKGEKRRWGKITDIWCPRLHTYLYEWSHDKEDNAAYISTVDDEIEDGQEWDSALFAFVECYDPYCSGPDFVKMLDLRDFSDGELKAHPGFGFEKPNNIPLRQAIQMEHWSKEWPSVEVAVSENFSTIDGSKCGDSGWTSEQLEYFEWAGEVEDPRTSGQRARKAAVEWADSEACKYLSERLGVEYDLGFYDHIHSKQQALDLAVSDPKHLCKIVLHNYRCGAQINTAEAVRGLAGLPKSDAIKEALRYIAKHTTVSYVKTAAKDVLKEMYLMIR
jgi:hypothetical protein